MLLLCGMTIHIDIFILAERSFLAFDFVNPKYSTRLNILLSTRSIYDKGKHEGDEFEACEDDEEEAEDEAPSEDDEDDSSIC